ncbi:MAG: hypothetical protein ACKVOM_08745 [Ferruginibacter sp.]
MRNLLVIFIGLLFCTGFFTACKKESFITGADATLGLSADSLKFDTVFTVTGSITKSFKILNNNDQKLLLSKIKLGGGITSPYKMNVNGLAAAEINNLEIAANDSIYVFVTVTVNPTTANLPFIINDSISINYNGLTKFVQLQAFGQNAVFIRNGLVASNVTFTNNLPYVILDGLQIASTGTLTINEGVKIYCHANAPIIVDGKLVCNGTKTQPIIFTGDRLDNPYKNFPASWPGIYFRATSKDNLLQFTTVKNAYQAVVVLEPSVNGNPKLALKQSVINNAFDAGLLCKNSNVLAENCLFSNNARNICVEKGGTYSFTHCTVVAYSNNFVLHQKPAAYLSDIDASNQPVPLTATLRNCIIYGDAGFVPNELEVIRTGNNAVSVNIDHCTYRVTTDPTNTVFTQSIKNINPSFDSIDAANQYYDFRVTKNGSAPGINKGITTPLLKDLNDNNRNIGLPDIGAYEKQ